MLPPLGHTVFVGSEPPPYNAICGGVAMSVDTLQEKIRKTKNPTVVELGLDLSMLPPQFSPDASGYCTFCKDLLGGLKGIVPAVRVSFSSFALLGAQGLDALTQVLGTASSLGFYVILDAPEILSVRSAQQTADALLGSDAFRCDAVVIGGYLGSDVIKPFLPYCKDQKKDVFVVARTANKSAPELQDLLAGSRVVHAAAADHVNRYGGDTAGKFGYTRIGILAGASSAQGLKNLRMKYPKLFLLLDGADYPNANAKNCSNAFDKFGHGAAACVSESVTCAWKQAESDGSDYLDHAVAAAERMKKNLTRYVTIL